MHPMITEQCAMHGVGHVTHIPPHRPENTKYLTEPRALGINEGAVFEVLSRPGFY